MELSVQYETLLGRGMPEHPRLEYMGTGQWYLTNMEALATGETVEGGSDHINDDDARDLITMHALRWWQGGAGDMSPFESMFTLRPDGDVVELLPIILAATEHLEPAD